MSIEKAFSFAQYRGRIRAIELASELGTGLNEAVRLIKILENRGVVSPADFSDWHTYILNKKETPKESNSKTKTSPPPRSDPLEKIAALEARVERLLEAGRIVISQRDTWQARALAAEAGRSPHNGKTDNRFAQVKRLLALEFHPDQSQGAGIDRLVREAIFKRLWPLIEDIEKRSSNQD